MTAWPAPSREAHNRFCLVEGWKEVRNARGRKVGHHITYELALPDGRVLRTRVSKPTNKEGYGAGMWSHILREQVQVDEVTFWACAREGIQPDRGTPTRTRETLPATLVHLLRTDLQLSDAEIASLSKADAIERMRQSWETGG